MFRPEENIFAVRGPAHGRVAGRFPGEAPRNATFGAHHVHVGESVLGGRVGDLAAVRRKIGAFRDRIDRSEPPRFTTLARNRPHIIRVQKRDLVCAEGGIAQKQRWSSLGETTQHETGQGGEAATSQPVAE
jgi:hypothetical protein